MRRSALLHASIRSATLTQRHAKSNRNQIKHSPHDSPSLLFLSSCVRLSFSFSTVRSYVFHWTCYASKLCFFFSCFLSLVIFLVALDMAEGISHDSDSRRRARAKAGGVFAFPWHGHARVAAMKTLEGACFSQPAGPLFKASHHLVSNRFFVFCVLLVRGGVLTYESACQMCLVPVITFLFMSNPTSF